MSNIDESLENSDRGFLISDTKKRNFLVNMAKTNATLVAKIARVYETGQRDKRRSHKVPPSDLAKSLDLEYSVLLPGNGTCIALCKGKEELLGSGGLKPGLKKPSRTKKGQDQETGEFVAVKIEEIPAVEYNELQDELKKKNEELEKYRKELKARTDDSMEGERIGQTITKTESEILALLNRLKGMVAIGEKYYTVQTLHLGKSVLKLLREGKLTLEDKLRIIISSANGLKELHDANVLHRDFHLANVICDLEKLRKQTTEESVVVMDFGCAGELIYPKEKKMKMLSETELVGLESQIIHDYVRDKGIQSTKIFFLAPELRKPLILPAGDDGEDTPVYDYSAASDVYNLGVTIQMLLDSENMPEEIKKTMQDLINRIIGDPEKIMNETDRNKRLAEINKRPTTTEIMEITRKALDSLLKLGVIPRREEIKEAKETKETKEAEEAEEIKEKKSVGEAITSTAHADSSREDKRRKPGPG